MQDCTRTSGTAIVMETRWLDDKKKEKRPSTSMDRQRDRQTETHTEDRRADRQADRLGGQKDMSLLRSHLWDQQNNAGLSRCRDRAGANKVESRKESAPRIA